VNIPCNFHRDCSITQKRNLNLNQHANLRTVQTCVRIIVHNCCTQHRTVLIIFPANLQTIIIAQTLSIGEAGKTERDKHQTDCTSLGGTRLTSCVVALVVLADDSASEPRNRHGLFSNDEGGWDTDWANSDATDSLLISGNTCEA